jgi:hypothetical protein
MNFRITPRDLNLLAAIARFRFLNAEQLQQIDGGSGRGVRNRLLLLTRAGHLVRVPHYVTEARVYGLANRGARLAARAGAAIDLALDWSDKNHCTRFFVAHTVQVADAVLEFLRAFAGLARIADHADLLAGFPDATQRRRNPFLLHAPMAGFDRPLVLPVIPDRLLALTYPDMTTHHFALELDRGTIAVWAHRLAGKSSWRRKVMAYAAVRERRGFAAAWACASLRILTVTTSDERIRHLLAAQRRAAPHCPPGFFLYTTLHRLREHGAAGPIWTSSRETCLSIAHHGEHGSS